jgi:CubicO group peptidase (beta-lactamase class C family)
MIVQDGEVIASWGDVAHKANIRSARKSLLSALYGIGVAEGRIRLDQTLGELASTIDLRVCRRAKSGLRFVIC